MRGLVVPLGLLFCLALASTDSVPTVETRVQAPERLVVSAHRVAVPAERFAVSTDAADVPVFNRDFPDPSVIMAGGRYYAFSTETAWERPGHVFPILVSRNLTGWSYVADVFSAPPAWGVGDWWAPAVVKRGGVYFLYYSGYARSRMHCLAVATATLPTGPYTDHGPLACQDGARAAGYIDASPLIAGGNGYLYFSVDGPDHHSISVLPLSADMLGVAGPRVELMDETEDWEKMGTGTVEGPSVFAWGTRYVMLYSGGDWRGQYGMGYAVATSPMGPFVKSGGQLLRNGGGLAGPGGGSYFLDSTGRPWLAYHGWSGGGRVLYMTQLSIS